jgi:hypothetical protein
MSIVAGVSAHVAVGKNPTVNYNDVAPREQSGNPHGQRGEDE